MPRILIVESDRDIQQLLVVLLTKFGFETICARNGGEALALTTAQPPDVIVTELALPVLDGWSLATAVREDPRTAAIPIVALTTNAWIADPTYCGVDAFDAVIVKPFDVERVQRLVQAALR